MKNLLFILLFISGVARSQSTSYDTTFTGSLGSAWNAMVNLPDDYYTTGALDSFACIIYFNGNGESAASGGVSLMDNYGPHYYLRTQGWNGQVELGNGTHKVIYISLQLPIANTNPVTSGNNYKLKPKLDAILGRYRIKGNKFHGMAISGGVGTALRFHTYREVADDDTYARYFQSFVSIQSRIYTSAEGANLSYPSRFGHTATLGFRALCFYQHLDGSDPDATWADNMRDSVAGSATHIKTDFNGGGHCCFNSFFDPDQDNWTTSNTDVMTVTGPGIANMNIYQWSLRQGDTSFVTGGSSLVGSAGADFFRAYDQDDNTPDFTITGEATIGTPTTWLWEAMSGPNTPTLTNETTATVTVSGATKGHYVFKLTVGDGVNTDTDSVNVWIRDYNDAGSWPCREGGGQVFEIGNTLISGVVSTTYINLPYINRAPYTAFGEQIQGGDTIKIHPNPNNGGVWESIVTGYVGGSEGCPVVIMSADSTPVVYENYWRMASAATGDTNFVNHVRVDGLAHRSGSENVYTFEFNGTGFAMVGHMVRNFELCGFYSDGGQFMFKKDSDSTKAWSIWNNYNNGPFYFHDNYSINVDGEAYYIGHTDLDGGGFDGPTWRGTDSSRFERLIMRNILWDGVQTSNMGSAVSYKHLATFKTGTENQSSQQSASFIGGYTQGTIDSCVFVNGTGGPQLLGAGRSFFKNSIVDSVNNGAAASDAFYANQALASDEPPPFPDSLEVVNTGNIYNRIVRYAANHSDANGRMKPGRISGNTIVDATRTTTLINAAAGDTVENNTYLTAIDIDTTSLALALPAWAVYKLIASDSVTRYSFFHVAEGTGNINPTVEGHDTTVYLPIDSFMLSLTASDVDGTIASYGWEKIEGPTDVSISNSESATPTIKGDLGGSPAPLQAGIYVFTVTVTDNDGALTQDTVYVTVVPVPNRKTRIQLKRIN